MSNNQATCQFCSKPDNSVQVVCESRCLLCSRCQLVPLIRKLLIEHTDFISNSSYSVNNATDERPGTGSNAMKEHNIAYFATKGICPICNSAISTSMLSIVQDFKEAQRLQLEEESMGKSSATIQLEETSPLIQNFFKRFRNTYEQYLDNSKPLFGFAKSEVWEMELLGNPETPIHQSGTVPKTQMAGIKRIGTVTNNTSSLDKHEIISSSVKLNLVNVLEFIVECYSAKWQSMCRNGNDSMLSIMMKQSNKKKFSQKTNDFKTKALIENLISFATGSYSTANSSLQSSSANNSNNEYLDLMLFNYLIGFQPRFSTKISTAWSHIATSVYIAIYFEKCLKHNLITIDSDPTHIRPEQQDNLSPAYLADFRNKLSKSLTTQQCISGNRTISLRKGLKIIKLLQEIRDSYWIMSPLVGYCIEYSSPLPWSSHSASKLLNVLFYLSLQDDHVKPRSRAQSMIDDDIDSDVGKTRIDADPSSLPTLKPNGAELKRTVTINSASNSTASSLNSHKSRQNASLPFVSNSISNNLAKAANHVSNSNVSINYRHELLKSLDVIIENVWKSDINTHIISNVGNNISPNDVQPIVDYWSSFNLLQSELESNDKSREIQTDEMETNDASVISSPSRRKRSIQASSRNITVNGSFSFVPLSIDDGISIGDLFTLNVNEFILVLIRCWEREYRMMLSFIEKSKIKIQRRPAMTGLNQSQAQIPFSAAEKQALVKLLYFYKQKHPRNQFVDIDWDEVESKYEHKAYPFKIPPSLFAKTRSQLSKLTDEQLKILKKQLVDDEIAALGEFNTKIEQMFDKTVLEELPILPMLEKRTFEDNMKHHNSHSKHIHHEHQKPQDDLVERLLDPAVLANDEAKHQEELKLQWQQHKSRTTVLNKKSGKEPSRAASQGNVAPMIPKTISELNECLPAKESHEQYEKLKDQYTVGGMPKSTLTKSVENETSRVRPLSGNPYNIRDITKPQSNTPSTGGVGIGLNVQVANIGEDAHHKNISAAEMVTMVEVVNQHHPALHTSKILPEYAVIDGPKKSSILMNTATQLLSVEKNVAALTFPTVRPQSGSLLRKNHHTTVVDYDNSIEDNPYKQQLEEYFKSKIDVSRQRILNRTLQNISDDQSSINNDGSRIAVITDNERSGSSSNNVLSSPSRLTWRSRVVPFLNLAFYISPTTGNLTLNLKNSFLAESAVYYMTLHCANCTVQALQLALQTYCKPWQLDFLKILDLSYNPQLGYKGSCFLTQCLLQMKSPSQLIHLNLNSMHIGDHGLALLLSSLIHCKGNRTLLRLDLKNNDITIAVKDSFNLLREFVHLRLLDISENNFTLDKASQWEWFCEGIENLYDMEYFSIAGNKIQDEGFQRLCQLLLSSTSIIKQSKEGITFNPSISTVSLQSSEKKIRSLKVLDVANCFLTNKSIPYLQELLLAIPRTNVDIHDQENSEIHHHGTGQPATNTTTTSSQLNNSTRRNHADTEKVTRKGSTHKNHHSKHHSHHHNDSGGNNTNNSSIIDTNTTINPPTPMLSNLQNIYIHNNLFTNNAWDELILDYQYRSACFLITQQQQPYERGIEFIPCYYLDEHEILVHPSELVDISLVQQRFHRLPIPPKVFKFSRI